jgi:hypothetical protein
LNTTKGREREREKFTALKTTLEIRKSWVKVN